MFFNNLKYKTLQIVLMTVLSFILFPAGAQEGLIFIQGGNFAQGPGWRTSQVLSRIRNAAALSLQGGVKKGIRERDIRFNILPPEGKAPFGIRSVFGGYEITVSSRETGWMDDFRNLNDVSKVCFAAGAGLPMSKMRILPDSWLFAAASYRGASSESGNLNRFGEFPAVRACVSRGIVPDIEQILRTPASPSDGTGYMFSMEWSFLLFELCRRHGVFHTSGIADFMTELAKTPSADQTELFRKHIYSVIANRFMRGGKKQKAPDMNEWFRKAASAYVCDVLHPVMPEVVEIQFQEIIAPDNAPSVYELAEKKGKLTPEENLRLARTRMQLMRLCSIVPAGCRGRLAAFSSAVEHLQMAGPSPETLKHLRTAGLALEKEIVFASAVDSRLREREIRMVPPGWRCELLLKAVQTDDFLKTPLMIQAERMLDKYER